MLVIQRTKGSSILMDDGINSGLEIKVLDVFVDNLHGKMVKLGLAFPGSYKIYREEVACAIKLNLSLDQARKHLVRQRAQEMEHLDNDNI
jgi:sRNA-binding carbon storage regulator CsrA